MNKRQLARVAEAREILKLLDFDGARSNDRSALTLLALSDLKPSQPWDQAAAPLLGIWAVMDFMRRHYAKDYAPNSRETIRRQTLHQFVDAGLVVLNPDDASRPVNSDKTAYQLGPDALILIRTHGKRGFANRVAAYNQTVPTLRRQYAMTRQRSQVPVTLGDGTKITLTPGGQNVLIKAMIEDFCPTFTPGGRVLYVGDAGKADPIFDEDAFVELGLTLDKHGKLPDLVVHMPDRNWLVLMEAASTHGPVDGKRHGELAKLFASSTAGLVYVSCFPSRDVMRKFLADVSWQTEVWCADDPTHLIHFDGERFLGPYA